MSRRIAHRPRYQSMRSIPQTPLRSYKDFLRYRWTYRLNHALPEAYFRTRHYAHSIGLSPFI